MQVKNIFAAIVFVLTVYTRFPVPFFQNGYFNLGDCFIIVAAVCLGPIWGGLAGGIGAGLSDLIGYPAYAPATFIIKWLMAVGAHYIYTLIRKSGFKFDVITATFAAFIAEAIMVAGYFVFEWFYYGGIAFAAASVIGNVLQGVCNIFAATFLLTVLNKTGVVKKFFTPQNK